MADKPYLLSDDEIISFIIHGSHIVEADFPEGFNESIYEELEALDIPRNNPGDGILDKVPKLYQVYDHPKVRGALVSLLGEDVQMNGHRHCHVNPPGTRSQTWHQDGTNKRHHRIETVLAMYYPQDVPAELGPTVIMPGTHFRNAPTDRMATYANFREQFLSQSRREQWRSRTTTSGTPQLRTVGRRLAICSSSSSVVVANRNRQVGTTIRRKLPTRCVALPMSGRAPVPNPITTRNVGCARKCGNT